MWNRRFIFLWAGQTLANLGDVFYIVAFISAIYAATGSVMYTALIPVVIVSSQSLSSLVAPLVFYRLSLQGMLILSQGIKTLLLMIAALVVPVVAGEGERLLVLLFGLGAMIAFMDGWANPARNALVPQLVEQQELMRANGLLATSDQTVYFVGWAAGGMLVAWVGSDAVLWGTVGAYVMATAAMLGIHPKKEQPSNLDEGEKGWLTGWRVIREVPKLRLLVGMDVLIGISGGVWIAAIMLPFVHDVLGRGEEWWGYINAGYMLGSIAGSALLIANAHRMKYHLHRWIVIGTFGSALVTFLFGSSTQPAVALFFSFALGPMFQMQMVSKQTALQQAVTEGVLPYVLSAKGTIDLMVFGISALMMGAIAEWVGTRAVYFLSSGILVGAVLFALRLRQSHALESEPSKL